MKGRKLILILVSVSLILILFTACKDTALRMDYKTISGAISWIKKQVLKGDGGGDIDDRFGSSVSVSGNYAVIGVPHNDTSGVDEGAAYLFKLESGNWVRKSIVYGDVGAPAISNYFGSSVDISGEYFVVGCPNYSSDGLTWDRGAVYIYKINVDGSCTRQEMLIGSSNSEYFGYSVGISGDHVIVGAYGYNSNIGEAYIYKRSGTDWDSGGGGPAYTLRPSDPSAAPQFSKSVSIEGNYAAIGAPSQITGSGQGKVYIYNNLDGSWGQFSTQEDDSVVHPSAQSNDEFGSSVDISEDFLAVGSPGNNGSAIVYKLDGGNWILSSFLLDSEKDATDNFGSEVAVNGIWAFVGSKLADDNGTDAGIVSVFVHINGKWTHFDRLSTTDVAFYDNFGSSIDITNQRLIIGAECDINNKDAAGKAIIFDLE